MHRLRVKFSREEELKYISHLDIMRLWQRAFHRAGVSLAYSEGFSPHPRISLAVPLPIGVTSEAELMDAFCTRFISPHLFTASVNRQLPRGIKIMQSYLIAPTLPSLQSQVRYAEYEVLVENEKEQQDVETALTDLLSMEHLPWQHQRDTGIRKYDLRTLIDDLWLIEWHSGYATIGMRLRCDSSGAGRPEQVAVALGFSHHPRSIHRTRHILETS